MTVSCLTTAMDTLSCSQKMKGRKPNFTDYELRVLLAEIYSERFVLLSRFQTGVTIKKKKEVWAAIAAKVKACGVTLRTEDECRQKWKDLKRKYLNDKTAASRTGGGPPEPSGPLDDMIFNIVGDNSSLHEGISVEGTETAVSVQDNDTSCTPVTVTQPDLYVTDCEITPHCVADIPNVPITIAATQPVIDERNTNGLGASFTNTPSYSRKELWKRLFSTKRKNNYNAESVTEESRLSVQFLKSQIEVNNLKKIKLELQIALLREKGQTTAAALK